MMKKLIAILATLTAMVTMTACSSESETVNANLDKECDNFQCLRRVVFYNAIKGEIILQVEGYCSVDPGDGRRMSVVCKVGNEFKRNALGASDNTTWWYEQMGTSGVSAKHYKVLFRPSTIIPEPEVR